MGYYVIMEEVEDLERVLERKMREWSVQTEQSIQSLGNLLACLEEKAAGAAAEAAGNYMREVHGCLLGQLGQLAVEMAYRYLQYAEGYYKIEADTCAGEIAQESLEEQMLVLEQGEMSFLEAAEELERTLSSVAGILDLPAPSTGTVESGFQEMREEVRCLWEETGTYEEERLANDFKGMEETMDSLESLIARCSGKSGIRLDQYHAGGILKYGEVTGLSELAQERQGYFMEAIPAMEEQMAVCQNRILAEDRVETGKQQVYAGITAITFTAISAAVIIGSGFSAVPAVAVFSEIVLGSLTTASTIYQVSEVCEGFQNIAFGRAGNITSTAGNPVRDLLPEEMHEMYEFVGKGSTSAVQAWAVIDILKSAKVQAGWKGVTEEAGKMWLAGTGAGMIGEAARENGIPGSGVILIETAAAVGIYGTLSGIRPLASAVSRKIQGLKNSRTAAENLTGTGITAEYRNFFREGKPEERITKDLLGIGRVEEYQAMAGAQAQLKTQTTSRVESEEIPELLMSPEALEHYQQGNRVRTAAGKEWTPEEIASWERYQDFLRNGSRIEPTREELIGRQRLMEYEALSRVNYEEVLVLRRGVSEAGTDAYVAPNGGGGITSTIKVNGLTVSFGHGGRHLEGTSLNVNAVNQALANKVSTLNLTTGQFHKGQIVVDGVTIEYTSYGVSDGIINVGTYYPLE